MAYPLVVVSDTKSIANVSVVTIDYGSGLPLLCRSGIWVGLETQFTEVIVLSYEHDPEELYVGWMLNGSIVSSPGFPPTIFAPGLPVPGAPQVTYMTPINDLYHRISFTSTAGMDDECVYAQVLYNTFQDIQQGKPVKYGPALSVCLSGREITWPADKLAEERQCLERWRRIFHLVDGPRHINPGDPVEDWLARVRGDDAVRIKALAQVIEKPGAGSDKSLVDAARAELKALFQRVRLDGRIAGLSSASAKREKSKPKRRKS
jgi:hypothetical protein